MGVSGQVLVVLIGRSLVAAIVLSLGLASSPPAIAAEWFVAQGGSGSGTGTAPFGRIQDAIDTARPGDVVVVRPGRYDERLASVRGGTASRPIVVRATQRGSTIVTASGRVFTVNHPFVVLENLALDGQYGSDDTVRVGAAASGLVLRNVEVRRSSRDLVDIGATRDVTIENCLIHRALNAAGGRTDAHGIAAGAVRNLTIRNTEIHTFSGDGVQVDPGRSAPGWDHVLLDGARIWLAPLAVAENGFGAGIVPGENAVDTKASPSFARARLTIRNTTVSGFRNGLIGNMAAFNLKEFIDATLDAITVFDSEIAFRLRGGGAAATGAWVTVQNAVVYRVGTAYRYEDEIRNLHILNNTIGAGVARIFRRASSSADGLDVRNLLVLGAKPAEASDSSNVSVAADAFVNAAGDDYRPVRGSGGIDRGRAITSVRVDRDGTPRPQGGAYDAGAYEWDPRE